MWELDCEEGWALKNWCFWSVVLEKTLESPLDCKDIKPVHSKGNHSWVFIGRIDAKAKTPILHMATSYEELTHWKIPWCWEGLGAGGEVMTEDEIAGWHHRLNGHEFEWTPGVGDGQGSLACCDSWGLKERDVAEWLNWTELILVILNYLSVPQISGCSVFIFIHFYAYFDFFFDFFCDLLVIQKRAVQPPYVGIFNSFSPVIEI